MNNIEDKKGNDRGDQNADTGVEMVGGKGLKTLGEWLAKRHDHYKAFMKRVQQMIAAVTLAEKEERTKDKQVQKAVLWYDLENG